MASGHANRIKRPDTWLHRPMLQNVKKALANPEPSTHGPISDMTAKSANTLPGLAVDADGTSAEGYHVEEPTRHHQILVEMDHVVFVSDRQMHAKGSANT